MRAIPIQNIRSTFASDNEVSIVDRREIEPLLTKARQVLMHYDKAMDLSTTVLDLSGQAIKTIDYEKQMRFCDFCRKYFHNPSQIWQGKTYPCDKVHLAALAKSRQTNKSYIYSCIVGFAYWTSPLYRNGRYAGAVTSGQTLLCGRGEAVEKFSLHCKDRIAVEKFKKMLAGVSEKSNEEIRAMAHLLEICAQEISEKEEDQCKTICSITQRMGEPKSVKITVVGNQVEKERMLLAAFQRGDNEAGHKIIDELVNGIHAGTSQILEIKRTRAIELLVLLSRATIGSGTSGSDAINKANNKNLRRIQESETNEELVENLHLAAGQMAGEIFSFRGMRHASALRRAQRHIWKNLAQKISLEEISKAAGLSAPYFSTIFKEEMGENFSNYINRLRVEKASTLLSETGNPIKTIASLCGFQDQSWFSKIFKNLTGITPGKYRETGNLAGGGYGS